MARPRRAARMEQAIRVRLMRGRGAFTTKAEARERRRSRRRCEARAREQAQVCHGRWEQCLRERHSARERVTRPSQSASRRQGCSSTTRRAANRGSSATWTSVASLRATLSSLS
eukprot:3882524-Prymnesium_polylepis.1